MFNPLSWDEHGYAMSANGLNQEPHGHESRDDYVQNHQQLWSWQTSKIF